MTCRAPGTHLVIASLISVKNAWDFSPRITSVGRVKSFSMSHVMAGGGGAASCNGTIRALSSSQVCQSPGKLSNSPGGSWNTASSINFAAFMKSPALAAATYGPRILAQSSLAFLPSGLSAGDTEMMVASYRIRLRTNDGSLTAAVTATRPPYDQPTR